APVDTGVRPRLPFETETTMATTLVQFDDWIKHTESLGARRSDELRALDTALRAYQADKSAAALTRVKNALNAWKKTQGAGDAWKKSRRNKDGYVELLTTQVEKGGDTDQAWGTTPNFMHENLINARLGVIYLFSHLTVSPRILKPDQQTKLLTVMEKVKRWFEDVAKGLLESLKEKWKCELPASLVKAAV